MSPNDLRSEIDENMEEYLRCGVRLIWFVEPLARRVTIHRTGTEPVVLDETEILDGGDVLTGFSYPLARLLVVS